ncbi:MAG: DNA replication and repair protein RecF [Candidatus Auribacterota bacterium]
MGTFYTVVFSPYDIYLIKGDPAGRRKLIDALLSQVSPAYLAALQNYRTILKQKNFVLKEHTANEVLLDSYNQQMARYGAAVITKRFELIETLNESARKIYNLFSRTKNNLMIYYDSFISEEPGLCEKNCEKGFLALLETKKSIERKRAISLVGPHLDDVAIQLNDKSARSFASEGQKRAIALSLRLAEYYEVKKVFGEPPVILMDDVFGELDREKKAALDSVIDPDAQLFFTCTDDHIVSSLVKNAQRFSIRDGSIFQ